jgi:hypothetical protein
MKLLTFGPFPTIAGSDGGGGLKFGKKLKRRFCTRRSPLVEEEEEIPFNVFIEPGSCRQYTGHPQPILTLKATLMGSHLQG